MKIAYLSISDPMNKNSWSGNIYHIGKALQAYGHEVDFFGPLKLPQLLDKFLRGFAKFNRVIFRKEYLAKCNLFLSWYAANHFEKILKHKNYDCICVPSEPSAVAFLKTKIPVFYLTDNTFKLITHYYNEFKKIPLISKIEGYIIEKKVLKKSNSIIYTSIWAAESAVHDYNVPSEHILITPTGANLDEIPDYNVIYKKLENKELTLLFLATEWDRKGGEIAFETLKFLQYSHGIKAKLIVCGCVPPAQYKSPHMEVIPFLNKNNKEDAERLNGLLCNAHFLIVPTRADCSLVTACEANAFGVPAITTETGGVPEVVKDGINGYCLPHSAGSNTYAALIAELFIDQSKYRDLVISSRQRFEQYLNWNTWAEGFGELFEKNTELSVQLNNTYQKVV